MKKIKLLCLPYAGGSAITLYEKWKKKLGNSIEVVPVELPGRGSRIGEPLLYSVEELVNDIYKSISQYADNDPYMLFGYSMGSWLAYEVVQKIMENGKTNPLHVFFAAKEAPHIERDEDIVYNLSDKEFIEEIAKYGGVPDDFFMQKELLDFFLPVLRADHEAVDTYEYIPGRQKLDFDITVFNGEKDDYSVHQISEWENQTSRNCKIIHFDDGHFFINNNLDSILSVIKETVHKYQ